ncbi:MAG: glutathione peroxidase [Fibrobacteres bacterium]|nr:glutathione peroxidase [Fibrobacterota bacterium]
MSELYDIPIRKADGGETKLDAFRGKVLLLVNVASKCGLTPQYEGLEKIYKRYKDRGLMILGFPANEFGHQEPGTDAQIQEFCSLNYGVSFPVFSKLVVKGPGQHPLYAYLTRAQPQATKPGSPILRVLRKALHAGSFTGEAGEITWNFEKFLVDREGEVAVRFSPDTKPEDPGLIGAIEAELAKPVPAAIQA